LISITLKIENYIGNIVLQPYKISTFHFISQCSLLHNSFMSCHSESPKCSLSDFPHRKNIVYRVNGLRQTSRRGLDSKYIMPPDSYHQLPSAFKKRMTNINYCFSRLFQRAIPILDVPKFKIAQVFKIQIQIQLSYRLKSTALGVASGYAPGNL
ncbi:hypothetical protein T09_15449, partial [Trichinella sp. T9]